jgi:ArsR family transcriptional regulator, arsenate/arsenite/antimonite-responsive transcriptional repressor
MVMTGISAAEAALIGKALGDPTRLSIYSHIANRRKELFCGELGECHVFSMATISHHLRVLTQAGLISSRRSGQYIFYRAIPTRLAQYRSYLARFGKKPARKLET